jgi:hypothetical protein
MCPFKYLRINYQDFIVRNDSPCGSTIGPITSAITGLKSVDIGAAQFGMHSIRETSGVLDVLYMQNLFDVNSLIFYPRNISEVTRIYPLILLVLEQILFKHISNTNILFFIKR